MDMTPISPFWISWPRTTPHYFPLLWFGLIFSPRALVRGIPNCCIWALFNRSSFAHLPGKSPVRPNVMLRLQYLTISVIYPKEICYLPIGTAPCTVLYIFIRQFLCHDFHFNSWSLALLIQKPALFLQLILSATSVPPITTCHLRLTLRLGAGVDRVHRLIKKYKNTSINKLSRLIVALNITAPL